MSPASLAYLYRQHRSWLEIKQRLRDVRDESRKIINERTST